jgi:DNA-directed RNA polymerase specialized sigma24 family protein
MTRALVSRRSIYRTLAAHTLDVEASAFGGLSVEEVADLLGVSSPPVKRDWSMARAWLRRELAS